MQGAGAVSHAGGGAAAVRPASISPLDYQTKGAHGQHPNAYPKLERAASSAPTFGAQDGPSGGYELPRASSSSSAADGFDCYNGKVMTRFTVKGAGSGDSARAKTGQGGGSAKDLFGRVQTY